MINLLLKKYWRYLATCMIGFSAGFYVAWSFSNFTITNLKIEKAEEEKSLSDGVSKALKENIELNDKVNLELDSEQNDLKKQTQNLEREIEQSFSKGSDSDHCGLDDNSLQFYKRALGYRSKGENAISNDTASSKTPTAQNGKRR